MICSTRPTAPCGTTAAALRSPCWAWRGASLRWCMLLAYGDGFGQAMRQYFRQFRHQAGDRGPGPHFHAGGRSEGGSSARPLHVWMMWMLLTPNVPQITRISRPKSSKQATSNMTPGSFDFRVGGQLSQRARRSSVLKLAQGRFYNLEDQMQQRAGGSASVRKRRKNSSPGATHWVSTSASTA